MDPELITSSIEAFHINGINSLLFAFSTNWCLIFLVLAAVASVILGIADQNASVVREEQNIL